MRRASLLPRCSLQSVKVTFSYTDFQIQWAKPETAALDALYSCWKTDIALGSAKCSLRITTCQTSSKRRCSYFSTSSSCVQKIVKKPLKLQYPTVPKSIHDCLHTTWSKNIHFIAQVIKLAPRSLSLLPTIRGAVEHCPINTEHNPFSTPRATLLGRTGKQYYSEMEGKGFSEQEKEKYPNKRRCLSG